MNIKTRLEKMERKNCTEGLLAVIVVLPTESREQAIARWRQKKPYAKLPENKFILSWEEAKAVIAKLKTFQEAIL